jgi:hypothetical protein
MVMPPAKLLCLVKPKRRRAQFSLCTLFVLVTVLCAVLVVLVPAERQRRAVVAIEAVALESREVTLLVRPAVHARPQPLR